MGNSSYGKGYQEGYNKAKEEFSNNKKSGCFGLFIVLITISTSLFLSFKVY